MSADQFGRVFDFRTECEARGIVRPTLPAFKPGDKVRVVKPGHAYQGRTGHVWMVNADNGAVTVPFNGAMIPWRPTDLERVE